MQPNKAVLLVGCAGAATAFLASRHWQPVLGELSFAAYAVSAGSGIFAYAVQLRRHVPAPRRLFSAYHDKPAADILSPLAAKWADGSYVRYRSDSEQVRKPALASAGIIPRARTDSRGCARYETSRKEGPHQLRHYYASAA